MRAGQHTIEARRGARAQCLALIALLGLGSAAGGNSAVSARPSLTIAAYPAVDQIVRAAIPQWKALHPDVDIQVISRQFSDHHTAMTTALSTRSHLPDVMALEVGYVGRFAQGGGLDNLAAPPYDIAQFRARWVPYAYQQATNRRGEVVAAPTDIGPGTLLYRQDVLAKAGVSEAELTRSWDSYVATGARIKAATGAYLMAHARDMKATYLALVADSISLVNGAAKTVYTMSQFESDAGINLAWPIPSPMLMKVALTDVGGFSLPADMKVSAAVSITEMAAGGKGEIQAYIANVGVKKTAAGLEIAVPTTSADALAYTVSTDAKKKLVIDFGTGVKGVATTLTTASNMTNSLVFGEVVQYAINNISGQGFTGIYTLRGKYRVTVVLTGLPLRRADGSALPNLSVVVPTLLNESGGVAASKTISGPGLVGYVTLTD